MAEQSKPSGPDLTLGIPVSDLADGAMLQGHVADEAVLLARRDDEYFAIGASCTDYGGPLAEGLMVGETVRCLWHHACFNLRTGRFRADDRPIAHSAVQAKGGVQARARRFGHEGRDNGRRDSHRDA